jgi:hypothetical protein
VRAHLDHNLTTVRGDRVGSARHVEAARRRLLGHRDMLLADNDRPLARDWIRIRRDVIADSPLTLALRRGGKGNPWRL